MDWIVTGPDGKAVSHAILLKQATTQLGRLPVLYYANRLAMDMAKLHQLRTGSTTPECTVFWRT
jgi:hypothetical protein